MEGVVQCRCYHGCVKCHWPLHRKPFAVIIELLIDPEIEITVLQTFLPASELSTNERLNAAFYDSWVSEDGSQPHNLKQFCLIIWLCGLYVLWQEMADSKWDAFLLLSRRMMIASAGFAVLSEMEYSRVNWTFTDKERSLSKKSAGERTRQNI